ncbi:hypothetical protein OESDEN_07211 [Oesophagostomum dentatum]|uniref:Transthyretin-like family protein n=1 Tax=Oesophagostomum dentatum TaxID=61180 RepID=A0A0B1T6L7_OESDE|nr:hypothetical protein OESDEN_07211 [Oesophagostomum dentatum]
MSRIILFATVFTAVLAKLQNVTIIIGEITCDGDEYLDNMKMQVWDKDIFTDDLLGEVYFNVTHPPQNISVVATEDEFFTMSPYIIFQNTCNGVRSHEFQ